MIGFSQSELKLCSITDRNPICGTAYVRVQSERVTGWNKLFYFSISIES